MKQTLGLNAMTNVHSLLNQLDEWFRSNCDGDWEHQQGINIQTCDNPGWILSVDLMGTPLEGKVLDSKAIGVMSNNTTVEGFLAVERDGNKFKAAGSTLESVLREFLTWAK